MRFYLYFLVFALALSGLVLLSGVLVYRGLPAHRQAIRRFLKSAIWGGFAVSVLLVFFVTNLPLPENFEFYCLHHMSPDPKYDPFSTLQLALDYLKRHQGNMNWYLFFRSEEMVQFGLNLFLLAPSMFFLRAGWRHGWILAVLVSFCISLLIELGQLTAFWGLAPCRYRTFDVEDLLANTISGLGGWFVFVFIAEPVARLLADRPAETTEI